MINLRSAKPIDLICTEPGIAEFPELLFGTTTDQHIYFDATAYIQHISPNLHTTDFFQQYAVQINAILGSEDIAQSVACAIDPHGHILIDSTLVYLFISFVKPEFLSYMCQRIDELFTNGIVLSDTFIASAAKSRLTPEILLTIADDEDSK